MSSNTTAVTNHHTSDFSERRMKALAQENAQLRGYVTSMMERLRDNDQLFSRLFDLEASVLAAKDPEDMCFTLLRELRSKFSLDMVRFWFDKSGVIGSCEMKALSQHDLVWLKSNALKDMGVNRRHIWLLPITEQRFSWLDETDEDINSVALLRLGFSDQPFGILGLGSKDRARFTPEQSTDFLQHLAQVISLSLEHAVSHERLARLTITDTLTGTRNRRFLQPYSHQPLSSWFGKGISVSALYFDMDNFKYINDNLGHTAGDELLSSLCEIIRQHVRSQDPIIRMGGDEFTLLLPGSSEEKSAAIALQILKDMRAHQCMDKKVSVSIGLACSTGEQDLTLNTLIGYADKAMYISKALGGDRLERHIHSEPLDIQE